VSLQFFASKNDPQTLFSSTNRLRIFFILIVFSFTLTPSNIYSQSSDLIFEQIFLDQGLSQSIVKCILQDEKGFMYFGTEDGLNRYDGYKFTVIRNDPENLNSISYNDINTIYQDHLGNIWIGTFNAGLNKYDPDNNKVTRFIYDPNNINTISHNNINAIIEDNDGAIWIGTDNGLNKIFLEGTTKENYTIARYYNNANNPNSLGNNAVHAIQQDKFGIVWVGTEGGLDKLIPDQQNPGNIIFKHYSYNASDPNSLSNNFIRTIYEDAQGILWIGTDSGLNMLYEDKEEVKFVVYKHNSSDIYSISHNQIYAVCQDQTGLLWIGTNGGGINLFNTESKRFTRYVHDPQDKRSLSYNEIRSLYRDRSGIMWIGTYGGGIDKVSGDKQKFLLYKSMPNDKNTLSHPIIWTIYEDDNGILWIGTHGGGLDRLDRAANKYEHFKHNPDDPNSLSNNIVRVVLKDSSGLLWIGTHGGGINKFDPIKKTFKVIKNESGNSNSLGHDEIRDIYKDKSGIIWIGTYGKGLDRYDELNRTFVHYRNDSENPASISNDFVRVIFESHSGVLWIGTEGGGLNKFNKENGTFKAYRSDPNDSLSISNDYIFAIHEDKSGALWLGTWGGGLNKFDPITEKFENYTIKDGLPSEAIYGILEDEKGNFWLSTNNGLSRFNPEDGFFKNYNVKDGLQNNEFNGGSYFKSKSGEMFFGGITGFNAFYPEDLKDNTYVPPLVITSFQKFNKEVEFDKPIYSINQIDLSYEDYVFSFEFASLDFSAPEKNKYLYKMEGLDKEWISTSSSRRFATYTTLPPGDYIFKVKGSNSDGFWNEAGASINITIHPPFWVTWWFRGLLILIIAFSGYLLYKKRVKNLEEKRKALSERLNEKTKLSDKLQSALSQVEILKNRLEAENIYLQDEIKLQHNFENIITQSEALKKLLYKVEQVASTDSTVLILGESGTGKELFTRAIHNISDRGERPLVKVNCSALPANLIESELFGHEKGAFTGAISRKIGRFELADGGTIFLDEIGDLPLELQPKILRVLQEGEFERIGNSKTIKVDVRIIAATNRDLKAEIEKGNFREDLFYRLNVFPISIPPLRERKEDIPLLVNYFVKKHSARIGRQIETVSQNIINALQKYYWPGNVRELENIIERALITSEGKKLTLSDWLPKQETEINIDKFLTIQENEKQHIIKALEKTDWRISGENGAAKILGIKRTTLEARMKKLNISR
jgi:DNA-binding NtrC family response regulator/ligand-binding sensor domain-containing protein